MKPYVGITGFTRREEVLSAVEALPSSAERLLMVGVLVSWKSLRGIPLRKRWQEQFPVPESIQSLLVDDERVLNLVHYSTEQWQEEGSVLGDMLRLHDLAGPGLHGFQLNIAWPEIRQLDEYRMAMGYTPRIVLQIGQQAVENVGGSPQGVVAMLSHYMGAVTDVLFDPSGGRGQPFDTERAREFLSAIAGKGWDIGLGVAGGLGPDSLHLVEPLLAEFPSLSIDAQGKLRDADNRLDLKIVESYIGRSFQMFN